MKLLLGIIALVALVFYFAYPIVRAIRVSKDIEKDTVSYEQHPQNPSMHILVGGDSTGVGTGAKRPEESIAGRIGADFPEADIQNISENGITIEELKNKLYNLSEKHYDLIVIQIGANDVTSFTAKKKVRTELDLVLEYATRHASSTVVLTAGNIGLSPTFKTPLSYIVSSRTRAVRSIFQEEISTHPSVTYVDLYKNRKDDVFSTDIKKYYARDFFHPSSEGYGVWYQQVQGALKFK